MFGFWLRSFCWPKALWYLHFNKNKIMPDPPPPWKNSLAKTLLQADILSGAVPSNMAPNDVYLTHPDFQLYSLKNFKVNLKSLRVALARDPTAGAPPKWKDGEAKELLKTEIISGVVPANMDAREVYDMHKELYHRYKFANFATNLKNLREAIASDHARMIEDAACYGHDVHIISSLSLPDYLPWHKSPAASLLAQDVADGMNQSYTPIQLYAMRPEYQVFQFLQFRKFIYQEVAKADKKEARFLRKQKQEAKKQRQRTQGQR